VDIIAYAIHDVAMTNEIPSLKANLGILLRGDYKDLAEFLEIIEPALKRTGVQLVHKHASASKLWIREGDEMNDYGKTH
jgi:hypothetical protein